MTGRGESDRKREKDAPASGEHRTGHGGDYSTEREGGYVAAYHSRPAPPGNNSSRRGREELLCLCVREPGA